MEKGTTLTVEQIPHLIQFLLNETISTGGVSIDERSGKGAYVHAIVDAPFATVLSCYLAH